MKIHFLQTLTGGALLSRSFQYQLRPPFRDYLSRRFASVTGTIYEEPNNNIVVTLFTKEGCTLCDTAKDVLFGLRSTMPHSLKAVDITDADQTLYWDKYKYDIPVLHINGMYWAKHRITTDAAIEALTAAQNGDFKSPRGEPNASKLERN